MQLHMQRHQRLEIPKPQIRLLRKSVMAGLPKVLGAQLDLRLVLLSIEIPANLHDRVKILALAKYLDSFLELIGLLVKRRRLLPVP